MGVDGEGIGGVGGLRCMGAGVSKLVVVDHSLLTHPLTFIFNTSFTRDL